MKPNFFIKCLFMGTLLFSGFEMNAQDWPDLGHFRKENAALGLPSKGENRVVFLGNSITQGWIEKRPGFFANRPYINRGISGQTTPQMLLRFRQDVIALQPGIVVILAGTNDIAGNTGPSTLEMIEDNLASMAELAKANGIRVVLSSVLPVYDYPWKPGLKPANKIIDLNTWIKQYCDNKGFIYLDYFSSFADENNGMKSTLTTDGLHANVAGYKVMEPLVEAAIQKALIQ
jgi:lysophospholipase L1-like esterase